MNGKELKRKLERDTGINVAHRTANRMKMTARDGDKATTAAGYQLLGSFCDLLQQQCPGSVAETQKHPDDTFKRCFIVLGRAAHVVAQSPLKVG
ncbi:unnamed protein product [Ectocarpus sp. CCAP 1310/34]|nr:unnamed protein product [Ectocarpus sp. CCAP 1310/34]